MPGYQIKLETISVAGLAMQVRSLLDRQQFHDPEGEAARSGISSATWPMFGLVWPSALVLAAHLQDTVLGERRILEVGCGLALASMSLHRRDGNVTASDYHPLAGAFLGENLALNVLPALPYLHGDWAVVNPALGQFDLIIGSDVLYERNQPALLAAFIERHSQAAMEVVIVDPDRGNRPGFSRLMGVLGFDCEELKVTLLPDGSTPYKGRVLSYSRAARPLPA
ncbi:MAG TPA: SAM-dependent methyltransferase [Rhizobacter sp.]|jgi:predicted nicotinamide N-methyase|nr:SAM-dependent methyltransferase [Rhizobacter sp.]